MGGLCVSGGQCASEWGGLRGQCPHDIIAVSGSDSNKWINLSAGTHRLSRSFPAGNRAGSLG